MDDTITKSIIFCILISLLYSDTTLSSKIHGEGVETVSILIQHNMSAWNAQRQFNVNTKAKNKKAEKLSSGYRINRAADDAAGLAISEKMRRQIRGLQAGTENAQMGVSWVQIGEGALNEAHDILQRMNELTIKSQNGTNTETDRAYMQAEFDALQSELDRISGTTTFNEQNIFEEHEPVYDQLCGNIRWDDMQVHEVVDGRNQLIISYRESAESQGQVITLEVPPGRYTTHELIDALDDAAGPAGPIHVEFTEKGICNLNLEGGEMIDAVTGDLQYLLWDTYNGGGYGALIGTTAFEDPDDPQYALEVYQGQNDYMKFEIEYFDGSGTDTVELNLFDLARQILHKQPTTTIDGNVVMMTKTELMKVIDEGIKLQEASLGGVGKTGLQTSHYGKSIMLSSDIGIVNGFKGNMFWIETQDPKFDSAFYDNIQQGYVWQDPAFVVGGAVLTTDSRDKEHNRFYIDGTNNTLVLQPNKTTAATTITIDTNTTDGYTADDMVKQLNEKFAAAGLGDEVMACKVVAKERVKFPDGTMPKDSTTANLNDREHVGDDWVYFEGVEIRTKKEGPDAIVNINKNASTAYDTLFTIKNYNSYGTTTDAVMSNETTNDRNAYAMSAKNYAGVGAIRIIDGLNDSFTLTLKSTKDRYGSTNRDTDLDYNETYTIDILQGVSYQDMNAAAIIAGINADLARQGLADRVVAEYDTNNNAIKIRDVDKNSDYSLDNDNDPYLNWNTSVAVDVAGNNAGYRDIFQQEFQYTVDRTVTGYGSLTLTVPTDGSLGSGMTVTIDGVDTYFDFNGAPDANGIRDAMNKATPIEFADAHGEGTSQPRKVTISGTGKESVTYGSGGTSRGTSADEQGHPGVDAQEPAKLAIGPHHAYLTGAMTIEKGKNDTITINLNGKERTLQLDAGDYATPEALAVELQKQINKPENFGEGFGGASVSIENGRFVLTSTIVRPHKGKETSITAYDSNSGKDDKFFTELNKVKTPAKAVSDQYLSNSITLTDGDNDKFTFTYTDSTGSHKVELDLTDSTEGPFDANGIAGRINDKLTTATYEIPDPDNPGGKLQMPVKVRAYNEGGRLVLEALDMGISISYSADEKDATANAIFGLENKTQASMTLNKPVQQNGELNGATKTFEFSISDDTGIKYPQLNITTWHGWEELKTQLNNQLAAYDVTADYDGNGYFTFTKNTPGYCKMDMTYASGGTVMGDMFGYEPKPNVAVTSNGTQITIIAPGSKIEVDSGSGGGLVEPTWVTAYMDAGGVGGFHSAKHSTVTSTALDANGIVLDRWNSDLKFSFKPGYQKTAVEVAVELSHSTGNPPVPTSLDAIKTELQTKIDAALQAQGVAADDGIEVVLDPNANTLSLKAKRPGSQYQFSGMNSIATNNNANLEQTNKIGGGFFHHVMCGYTEVESKLADPTDINGEQFADDIFAQGRHDVVIDPTHLQSGVSDNLVIDLNFIADKDHDGTEEGAVKTLSIRLKLKANEWEEGVYSGEELKNMIQEKLDWTLENYENWDLNDDMRAHTELKELKDQVDALKAELGIDLPLHPGLIEVDIGRHDTGIYGNKDKVAISFTMTKDHDIATPAEGFFYIDGIRGNAAYETFYHTIGKLIPAYIIGTKDLSDGVVFGENDNELTFLLEGELKVIDLSGLEKGRKYTAEEIVNVLTDEFAKQNLPLAAEITKKGCLKISYTRMGKHTIEQVTGSARNQLFFEEHAEKKTVRERTIRVSSNEGDRFEVYSPQFSTMMLGINSICVSTVENAEKATNRLKDAIKIVSDMRSTFGAQQNRLEHTINNNRNNEENTQAAESRIRDADISKEMVEFSNLNILQQAGQAVMAQAQQNAQLAMQLLT